MNKIDEIDKGLDMELKTVDELSKYNKIIKMPLAQDNNELNLSLKTNFVRKKFNEYDFIKLFCAELLKRGVVKINFSQLGYQLIDFYKDKKYSELFDMQLKQNNQGFYVDVSSCIEKAKLERILSLHSIMNTDELLIMLSSKECENIINSYDKRIVSKMKDMVYKYINKSVLFNFYESHKEYKKYPIIQLITKETPFYNMQYFINDFDENIFNDKICLMEEDINKEKCLSLEKKLEKSKK